jgi:hypothetical protein
MPLIKSKSPKAFSKNVEAEMHAGKPQKQALAIAYSVKREAKKSGGGLYANIHAKQERIKHGSDEHMRKLGSKGAPTADAFVQSAKTAKKSKGGEVNLSIKRGEKLPTSQGAGLTAKGREKYNRETGSHLKAPQPQGGARKKSFCARMSGMPGPMKDENGKPTRKAASLKRWNCATGGKIKKTPMW